MLSAPERPVAPDAAPPPPPQDHSHRVTLTVAATLFMLLLDSTILNTSLPAMAAALQVRPLMLSATITVYLLAAAAVLPLASWLGDRYGLRRLFVVSVAVFTVASLLCGAAQTALQLVLARALQGFGGGLMMPAGRTLALQHARKEDVIRVAALLTWPALFAPVLGPPLGGLITTYASWRWNFLLNVPLGLSAIALIVHWVPAEHGMHKRPLDVRGALGSALGLMTLIGGLEWVGHAIGDASERTPALATVAVGLAILAWTTRHLRRTPHPVVSLAPFNDHTFAVATTAGGTFANTCLQATPFLLPLFFQLTLGRSAVASGALLLPYFLGNLAMKTITTPILVRFGFRRVMITAAACSAVSIAAFALVTRTTPQAALVALLVAAGCSRSMLMTSITSLTFADVPIAQRAAASTLSTISLQFAGALGVAVGAIALAAAEFAHGRTELAVADFHAAFLAVGVLCAFTVLSFARLAHDAGAEITRGAARASKS